MNYCAIAINGRNLCVLLTKLSFQGLWKVFLVNKYVGFE